ncbi:MAG: HD domain-containing phosphohydrolase [Bacillota bacterium]|nr:HD domain-containing phosphohydrolase [Bacillota bacterium]
MERLQVLAGEMADCLQLHHLEREKLMMLVQRHDIGKVTVPDEILLKPGPLTKHEWAIVKKHSETGYRLANSIGELRGIADLILYHHENYDGNGYPRGLKENEIPFLSRLLAILDAFDVMTHDQVYKEAVSEDVALERLELNAGTQFDPELVKTFIHMRISKVCEEKNVP